MDVGIARLRERREMFKAQGLCVSCGAATEEGKRHCAEHLAYYRRRMAEKRKQWRNAGLCVRCGKQPPLNGYSMCAPCRTYQSSLNEVANKKRLRTHSSIGFCNIPNATKFSADWDDVDCETCLRIAGREL